MFTEVESSMLCEGTIGNTDEGFPFLHEFEPKLFGSFHAQGKFDSLKDITLQFYRDFANRWRLADFVLILSCHDHVPPPLLLLARNVGTTDNLHMRIHEE